MPIRGLTEQRQLPRLGKLHLGTPNPGGYPTKTDYFVIHDDDPLAALFHEVYGAQPKELDIRFPTHDPEDFATQFFYAYKKAVGRVCKGDGFKADALLDADKMKQTGGEIQLACWAGAKSEHVVRQVIDCGGEGYEGKPPCPMFETKNCKRLMMLQFLLDDVPGLGVWQVDTSSIHSIRNINNTVAMVRLVTGDKIAGIRLKLRLVPLEVAPDGKKKTVYVLQLEIPYTTQELLQASTQTLGQLLLPPADDEEPDDVFPENGDEPIRVEGEVIPPQEAESLAEEADAHAEPEPPLIEEEIVPPSPRQEKPPVQQPLDPQTPPAQRQATRVPRAGEPVPGWMSDYNTLSQAAIALGFTEAQVLRYLGISEPREYEDVRNGRPVAACIEQLKALKESASKNRFSLEQMVANVVARRETNGKTFGE